MKLSFKLHEIDHHILKLIVGLIALSLANVTAFFSADGLDSISDAYHKGGWARDFLVGSLFAISAFLFAYNGEEPPEMVLSKLAGVAALGVALFPCRCGVHDEILPYVHGSRFRRPAGGGRAGARFHHGRSAEREMGAPGVLRRARGTGRVWDFVAGSQQGVADHHGEGRAGFGSAGFRVVG